MPASAAEFVAPQSALTDEDAFGRFIQFLRKRGWLILLGLALGLAAAFIANLVAHKRYTAFADIEIVPDKSGEYRLEAVQDFSGGGDDAEKLDTETQILQSRTLALHTISSLHLDKNSDFLPVPEGGWDLSSPAVRQTLASEFDGDLNISRKGAHQHSSDRCDFRKSKPGESDGQHTDRQLYRGLVSR